MQHWFEHLRSHFGSSHCGSEISVKHIQFSRVRFFPCVCSDHNSSDLLVYPVCSSVGLPTPVFVEFSRSRWSMTDLWDMNGSFVSCKERFTTILDTAPIINGKKEMDLQYVQNFECLDQDEMQNV